MLLDEYLPEYDVVERHRAIIDLPQAELWDVFQQTDFSRSFWIRTLFRLRGMAVKQSIPMPMTFATLERWRFKLLDEVEPDYMVIGLVGKFWTPTGHLQRIDKRSFLEEPWEGFARSAFCFEFEALEDGATVVATETRVHCTDERSRRAFRRYWAVIGPFSKWIRRLMLQQIERHAIAGSQT